MKDDIKELNDILSNLQLIIEGVRKIRVEFSNKSKNESLMVVDVQLFLYLQSFDLIAHYKNYLASSIELERKLFCWLIALNIYEFLDDIGELLGKKFKRAIKEKNPVTDFEELNLLRKRIVLFKTLHGEELKTIRHELAAHKGHEPLKQIELIEKIDAVTFVGHSAIIYQLSVDINSYLSNLLEQIENV